MIKEEKKTSAARKTAAELRIVRVTEMETRLNRAAEAVIALESALEKYSAVREDFVVLERYLASTQWKRDFAASETGKLPPALPHGVLSEDGIYNILERRDDLFRSLAEFGGE